MNNKEEAEVLILLSNGVTVPRKLYMEIYKEVTDVFSVLHSGTEYSLKKLCDPDYWKSLTLYQRILAGMCMTHMVRNNYVRYTPTGKPCQSPKAYSPI